MKKIFGFIAISIGLLTFSCTPKYTASFGPSQKFYDGKSSIKDKELTAKNDESVKSVDVEIPSIKVSEDILTVESNESNVVNDVDVVASRSDASSAYKIPKVEELIKKYDKVESEIQSSGLTSKEQKRAIRKEKRKLGKEVKREIKNEIKEIRKSSDDDEYVLMMVLAILIPPLGVGLTYGITAEFWISLLLTLIFWLPGAIYSIIKVHQHFKG